MYRSSQDKRCYLLVCFRTVTCSILGMKSVFGCCGRTGVAWPFMPPLPDTVSILLRSSPTAAMAALLLISTSHRGLLDWFSRTVSAEPAPESEPAPVPPRRKARASVRCGNGHRQSRANGDDPYLSRRLAKREADDKALLDAMRRNPEATIGDLATAVGKSRTSIVSALRRLRDAGLAKSDEGRWRLTEEPPPRSPPERWTAPLSASQRAHVHA
jgi:DNA-binding transcriptional ArsR family regulator